MIRATLTILGFCGLCHPANAACVDTNVDDGSTSLVAICGVADPAVLAVLAGMSGSEASYPAPWTTVINEISGASGFLSPQEARDYILRVQSEQNALKIVGSLSSQDSSKSLVVHFSASDPTIALSWLMSLPDDTDRGRVFAGYLESISSEKQRSEALQRISGDWSDGTDTTGGDPRRDRLSSVRDRDIAQSWIDGNQQADFQTVSSAVAVPEPSAAILAVVGALGLLRRRR